MKNASNIAIGVIAILHTVGLFGLNHPSWQELFQKMIPLNILITLIVVLFFHSNWSAKIVGLFSVTAMIGYASEVVGVQTGILFGDYRYEENLGFKIWEVPIILGLNWLVLIYCSRLTANFLLDNKLLQAFTSASLMVLMDIFLEPFAVYHDMWEWKNETVPIKNYVSWFIVAFPIQLLFNRIDLGSNKVGIAAFVIMLSFFIFNLYFI